MMAGATAAIEKTKMKSNDFQSLWNFGGALLIVTSRNSGRHLARGGVATDLS